MIKIERIIPYAVDALAALISASATFAVSGLVVLLMGPSSYSSSGALLFFAAVVAGAFVGIRITRGMVRDQVHMELAEGGK